MIAAPARPHTRRHRARRGVIAIALLLAAGTIPAFAVDDILRLPDPDADDVIEAEAAEATAVFAGGCFWGVEAVFEHVRGVKAATAGYSGGSADSAHYDVVTDGHSGHAEAVKVTYDPGEISYGQLLKVFFEIAHDPTQRNRQGPDRGREYRSVIFAATAEQQRIARAYIAQLDRTALFGRKIATKVEKLKAFYEAESNHQDYVARNPASRYVRAYDAPKLDRLRLAFPEKYRE